MSGYAVTAVHTQICFLQHVHVEDLHFGPHSVCQSSYAVDKVFLVLLLPAFVAQYMLNAAQNLHFVLHS